MPSKKHPLEIFRKHGAFGTLGRVEPGRSVPEKKPRGRAGDPSAARDRRAAKGGGRRKAAPGDRRISLSLNQVLVLLLIMVALSLFTYFLGYHKGLDAGSPIREASLGNATEGTFLPAGGDSTQPNIEKRVTTGEEGQARTFYGVQVGVWTRGKQALAEEAAQWLTRRFGKKGTSFRVSPLADTDYVTIIAGSFSSGADPELHRLLEAIRGVNDYPSGGASPFRSAKIVSYSLAVQGS